MNILISACLLGDACRYDGKDNLIEDFFDNHKDLNFIKICPEVEAGMPTPRKPSEIRKGRVYDFEGFDNTDFFVRGAELALEKAKKHGVKIAILKSKSPSCGNGLVYDGTFSKKLVKGDGITANLLKKHGIKVFSEKNLDEFEKYIKSTK
jgi:uncharacterized protein YbbK (DUF523 family)